MPISRAFMTDFRAAFPDLKYWGTADLIAEGDYVVGQWEGGGTHTGPAFSDFLAGSLPAERPAGKCTSPAPRCSASRTAGSSEEIGLDDGAPRRSSSSA